MLSSIFSPLISSGIFIVIGAEGRLTENFPRGDLNADQLEAAEPTAEQHRAAKRMKPILRIVKDLFRPSAQMTQAFLRSQLLTATFPRPPANQHEPPLHLRRQKILGPKIKPTHPARDLRG